MQSDTQILKKFGPQLKDPKKGEVILLDGGFPEESMVLYQVHPTWQAKYNDGHSLIWGLESIHLPFVHLGCVPQPMDKVGDETLRPPL